MSKKGLYIEQRPNGEYAVVRSGAKRASAITSTQKDAIKVAKALEPDAKPRVERVRDTSKGGRDRWRPAS